MEMSDCGLHGEIFCDHYIELTVMLMLVKFFISEDNP